MLRIVRLTLLCNVICAVVTISSSQADLRPVRQVVTEAARLGILQGECPSIAGSASASGASPTGSASASASGASPTGSASASASGASPTGSASASASGASPTGSASTSASGSASGSGGGSGFPCASIDERTSAFCATAFREQLCPFLLSSDTCNICTSLSNLCGPFSGSIDAVCSDGQSLSVCSAVGTQFCNGSVSQRNPFVCDFCRFVQQRCVVSSASSTSSSGSGSFVTSSSGSGSSRISASGSGSGNFLTRRRRQTVVTSAGGMFASGVSASGSASGSGSDDFCSITYQAVGPLCANALQAELCEYNFTSQTCDLCTNLRLTCGPPEGRGDIDILCASLAAQQCTEIARSCFEDQTIPQTTCDFCSFVGNSCFQPNEAALCDVEGLLDDCTSVLNVGPYECECFVMSSTCNLCRTVDRVCSPPATIPVSLRKELIIWV